MRYDAAVCFFFRDLLPCGILLQIRESEIDLHTGWQFFLVLGKIPLKVVRPAPVNIISIDAGSLRNVFPVISPELGKTATEIEYFLFFLEMKGTKDRDIPVHPRKCMLYRHHVVSVGTLVDGHALHDRSYIVPVGSIVALHQGPLDGIDHHLDTVALLFHLFQLDLKCLTDILRIAGIKIITDLFE